MTTTRRGMVHPSRPTRRSLRAALLAVGLTVAGVAVPGESAPAGAETQGGAPGLAYSASSCKESVALVAMPRSVLEARLDLPEPFMVREFAPGVALLGVAVASCESISVGGKQARPGRFSDVGVMIEPAGTWQMWLAAGSNLRDWEINRICPLGGVFDPYCWYGVGGFYMPSPGGSANGRFAGSAVGS